MSSWKKCKNSLRFSIVASMNALIAFFLFLRRSLFLVAVCVRFWCSFDFELLMSSSSSSSNNDEDGDDDDARLLGWLPDEQLGELVEVDANDTLFLRLSIIIICSLDSQLVAVQTSWAVFTFVASVWSSLCSLWFVIFRSFRFGIFGVFHFFNVWIVFSLSFFFSRTECLIDQHRFRIIPLLFN